MFSLSKSLKSSHRHVPFYFSGIQPTGTPHLGNYFGFIQPWLNFQQNLPSSTRMCLSVVDQHAISVGPKPADVMRKNVRNMAMGLLACGVSPEITLLFRQSDVPQISQLMWILGSMQTVAKLNRMPQFKDKATKFSKGDVPVGLLTYPVLQAADVLMFKATHVPVGEDQSQHLNLLTDLAINFNAKYETDFFPVPQQVTTEGCSRVKSLRDPEKKMSKSDLSNKSRLEITESPEDVLNKCKKAVTDSISTVAYDPINRKAISNLIDLYVAVSNESIQQVVDRQWDTVTLKVQLAQAINDKLEPIREKYNQLERTNEVDEILHENGKKAFNLAAENMENIRKIIGFL